MTGSDWSKELKDLYPFLQGHEVDAKEQETALLDSISIKSQLSIDTQKQFYIDNSHAVLALSRAIATVYAGKGKMLCMGNGGSSCDAAHFAVEFQHPVTTGRPALPAMNLSSDIAMISAVGNDIGFDNVFLRQVEAHGRSGDGIIGFSTSGNSKNLLEAFRKAKEMDMVCFGITGGDGGLMQQANLDHCLVVKTDSIHRVQEVHVTLYHIVWDLVHTLLAGSRGKAGAQAEP